MIHHNRIRCLIVWVLVWLAGFTLAGREAALSLHRIRDHGQGICRAARHGHAPPRPALEGGCRPGRHTHHGHCRICDLFSQHNAKISGIRTLLPKAETVITRLMPAPHDPFPARAGSLDVARGPPAA